MWLSPPARWIGGNKSSYFPAAISLAAIESKPPWLVKRDAPVVAAAATSGNSTSNTQGGGGGMCGSHGCLMVLGSICAGMVVVAVVIGLVMQKVKKTPDYTTSPNILRTPNSRMRNLAPRRVKTSFTSNSSSGGGGREKRREELMMEMFEPLPEDSPFSAAATLGRLSKVFNLEKGLTTISEEFPNSLSSRGSEERRRSNRPIISPYLTSTPQRLNSPIRLLRGPTPPPSPSAGYTAALAAGVGSIGLNGPGMNAPQPAVTKQEKKRKLTIPYNPHNVTRRRSLEGAW